MCNCREKQSTAQVTREYWIQETKGNSILALAETISNLTWTHKPQRKRKRKKKVLPFLDFGYWETKKKERTKEIIG